MPIYAYKCGSCGHAKDVLQKLSDEPLRVCPPCSAPAFSKQVTAAGFQLKGSGWYVTDFRGGSTASPAADGEKAGSGGAKPAETAKTSDAKAGDATVSPAKSAESPPASTKTDAPSASAGTASP
jgi:putative FmdB family regulatory protein